MSRMHIALICTLVAGTLLGRAVPTASAQTAGPWTCYVVDRFPDVKDASTWKGASKTSQGLDLVAADAAAGTILTTTYPTSATQVGGAAVSLVCVKR